VFSFENGNFKAQNLPVHLHHEGDRQGLSEVRVVQLPEANVIQAPVALEEPSCFADDRPRGDGGELVASIGLVKWSM
jgi:hypothetical protein